MAWIVPESPHDNAGWHRFNMLTAYCAPIPAVVNLLHGCIRVGITPIITTGRDGAFRHGQLTWLQKHGIPVPADHVFGRTPGDKRKDSVVKTEILETIIVPRFGLPWLAVDDRPAVAQVWRDHGIPTIDVVDPGLDPVFLLGVAL